MPIDPIKIKTRREKLRLTQTQAAEAAGLAQPNWARLEAGKMLDTRLTTAESIARALRTPLGKLLA